MTPHNLHATALVVGGKGLLVTGASGAGKSSLALELIGQCRTRGMFATLICDDRIWIRIHGGRVVAEAPKTIAGLIEIRGFGPARTHHVARAVIDGVVTLVEPDDAPRHREDVHETLLGVVLPRLDLRGRQSALSARAVLAWIGHFSG